MLFHWHHLSASEEAMGIWSSGIWSSGFGVRNTIVLVLVLVRRSPFTVHRSQAQSEHRPWCSQLVGLLTPELQCS